MNKEAVLGIMLILLLISMLTLEFNIEQVKASPLELSDFTENITSYLPAAPYSVATISNGTIFMGDDVGNVYQSDDGGYTWSNIFNDINKSNCRVKEFFTDSNDNVYFWVFGNGRTWKWNYQTGSVYNVTDRHPTSWHWGEQSNGSIYFNVYGSTSNALMYSSDDGGETFPNIIDYSDIFGFEVWHSHGVRVDPFTDDLYWFTGDITTNITIRRWDNGTNTWVSESQGRYFTNQYGRADLWITDMTFDANYIYLGGDTAWFRVQRVARGENFTTHAEPVLRSDDWLSGSHIIQYMEVVDGIILVSMGGGPYWASWDGEHWYTLWDNTPSGVGRNWGQYKTVDGAIIVVDESTDEICKFFVDVSFLQKLFYAEFTTISGDLLTIEQTVRSGTNYLDISEYGVKNANISFIGQAQDNIISDSDMESGQVGGDANWYERWNTITMQTSEKHLGTYAMNFTPDIRSSKWLGIRPPQLHVGNTPLWIPTKSPIYFLSGWVKGDQNTTDAFNWKAYLRNSTDGTTYALSALPIAVNNVSWTHFSVSWFIKSGYDATYFVFTNKYASGYGSFYIDDVQLEYYESTIYDKNGMTRQYIVPHTNYTRTTTQIETNNPSVTVGSQTFSHVGDLNNGTESQTWSLAISSGIIEFNTTVYGSGMVKVKFVGEKSLTLSNAFIRNEVATNLFNGIYYGTPTIATSENYLIVLGDKKSIITAISTTTDTMTLTISGTGTTTTYVYCDDKGEPTAVYAVGGNVTWNCNASTAILTLNVAHASPARIRIYWKLPGDLDSNGIVDIFDISSISAHWYPGPPLGPLGYDAGCDINNDGAIDSFDICICCAHWAETC